MSFFRQLGALLRKDWIIRSKNPIATVFELFPAVLLAIFAVFIFRNTAFSRIHITAGPNGVPQKSTKNDLKLSKPIDFDDPLSLGPKRDVFYSPANPFTDDMMATLKTISNWTVTAANSSETVRELVSRPLNETPTVGNGAVKLNVISAKGVGIIFAGESAKRGQPLKYTVITKADEEMVGITNLRDSDKDAASSYPSPYDKDRDTYKLRDIIAVINEAFFRKAIKDYKIPPKNVKAMDFKVFPMPADAGDYPKPRMLNRASTGDIISVSIVLGYIVLCPLIVRRVTNEKSNKVKELMRMMGMSDWVFWSSHFVNYILVMTVHTIIFTLLFIYGLQLIDMGNGRPIFDGQNFLVFFIIVWIFCVQTILFCMAFTTVFNQPVVGVIVMVISYILVYGVGLYYTHPLFTTKEDDANFLRIVSSIYPSFALTWTMALMGRWEYLNVTVGVAELFKQTPFINLSLGSVLAVQIFSCFLWSLVIWYLDAVWPQEEGLQKPVYFPCLSSYWYPIMTKSKDVESTGNSRNKNPNFETPPEGSKTMISLKHVSKDFGSGRGVKDMTFDIYGRQITVLLGHNGAGKTTTMSMITGIYPPTSGNIFVNGFNVLTATRQARKSIGLCPQENILFNDLSVVQHLRLYAVLKDYPKDKLKSEIERVLQIIRLVDKKHWKSSSLSGGMKRKLSLGMALIGDTEILILDEPTSGMDPEARRAIWDVLQSVRHERTIMLTTHYMEEADVLGDRIAIMSEGVLKCCGSPMYLKKRFGAGYHLTIAKSDNFNESAVGQTLKKYLPDSRLKSQINTEVIYSLESEDHSKQTDKNIFPKLFDELEGRKQELGFNSFGITVTTMEDVFIKVGSNEEINPKETKTLVNKSNTNYKPLTGFGLIWISVYGLLVKRVHYGRRHWSMLLFQIIIPALLLMVTFLIDHQVRAKVLGKDKSLTLDLQQLYGNSKGFYKEYKPDQFGYNYYIPNGERQGATVSRLSQTEDPNNWLLKKSYENFPEYVLKYVFGGALPDDNTTHLKPEVWFSSQSTHSLPISINLMYESLIQWLIPSLKNVFTISPTIEPLPSTVLNDESIDLLKLLLSGIVTCVLFMPITLPFLGASFIIYPIIERYSKSKSLQLMTGLSAATYWLSNYLFDILNHLLAVFLLMIVIYIFDSDDIIHGKMTSIVGLFLLLLAFGLASISIAYCLSFWFNSTALGFSLLMVFYLVFGFIISAPYSGFYFNDIMTFKSPEDYWIVLSLSLYLFRLIPIFSLNYGFTKLYGTDIRLDSCDSMWSVFRAHMPSNWSSSVNIPDKWDSEKSPQILKQFGVNHKELIICEHLNPLTMNPWGIGRELVGLVVSALLFILILLIIEENIYKRVRGMVSGRNLKLFTKTNEDSDVLTERQRVDQMMTNPKLRAQEGIVVCNLTKHFGSFCAVNHLSFGVHKNECFGLLGVNGAGKTTTFSMLTGDEYPSDGNAFIDSVNLLTQTKTFKSRIGYCPQFDALLDRLTGEEMLYLFGRLRGIPWSHLTAEVNAVIEATDLKIHCRHTTKNYSGGNKRKLSLGLAIIGRPPLVFLDEPTAGVDPVARRKIWQTLSALKSGQNSSIILTSHSMEESEALCSRIAIMVGGNFQCLGSSQQLKSKFGQGFTLIVKLKHQLIAKDKNYPNRVDQYIIQKFPSAVVRDRHEIHIHYHITDTQTKWSQMFEVMQTAHKDLDLEDYNLSDTSLEQIFLSFAKQK